MLDVLFVAVVVAVLALVAGGIWLALKLFTKDEEGVDLVPVLGDTTAVKKAKS
ncbi:MAG: hypothetical protein WD533_03470 [Dehalococcoidia bacterium]